VKQGLLRGRGPRVGGGARRRLGGPALAGGPASRNPPGRRRQRPRDDRSRPARRARHRGPEPDRRSGPGRGL